MYRKKEFPITKRTIQFSFTTINYFDDLSSIVPDLKFIVEV